MTATRSTSIILRENHKRNVFFGHVYFILIILITNFEIDFFHKQFSSLEIISYVIKYLFLLIGQRKDYKFFFSHIYLFLLCN